MDPEKMGRILTSIGLEVENIEPYESLKGNLAGVFVGEVITCTKHPDADKLSLTTVNIGTETLQIVCGAPNVAVGQKVAVAVIGTTIYPTGGEPLTMKKAKIRGVESHGMICAEDELGLSDNHAGIMLLDANAKPGTPVNEILDCYTDHIYEIGLTPNRMDAMSHLGVARDVCAYLGHHSNNEVNVKSPLYGAFKIDNANGLNMAVTIENTTACERYSGVVISGITVGQSPVWIKNYLNAIGIRSINNVVDITNFILHETGQPLHAFDADKITNQKVIVKNLPQDSTFTTLDEKERKLHADDLIICDGNEKPMCIGGVFGGLNSGVTETTSNIFLESAWFNPISIRKTSFRHGLRTDAATRFEKGVDISNTLPVLKRAALLIKEICGGELQGKLVDEYPNPKEKTEVSLKYHYLKKLSGKNYHPDAIKNILKALGFEFIKEGLDDLWFKVPYSKPDISLPADLVEEIMRIDGYDNVEIPTLVSMTPAINLLEHPEAMTEKISNYLVGAGFNEIFTNSITNKEYYSEEVLSTSVKMINNLSAELNIMRPSMLETGLESVAHNINRKNTNLRFFEIGSTYTIGEKGFNETKFLNIYLTGNYTSQSWNTKAAPANLFILKGIIQNILAISGLKIDNTDTTVNTNYETATQLFSNNNSVATIGKVDTEKLKQFGIKQPVYNAIINWSSLLKASRKNKISFFEIPKYPSVERDLAVILNKNVTYNQVETIINNQRIGKLQKLNLFDVFESEKIGAGKKSMAINFTFLDKEKTMTDKDIDGAMQKIISGLEKELNAEVRK